MTRLTWSTVGGQHATEKLHCYGQLKNTLKRCNIEPGEWFTVERSLWLIGSTGFKILQSTEGVNGKPDGGNHDVPYSGPATAMSDLWLGE